MTRRFAAAFAVLLLGSSVLAACGEDAEDGSGSTPSDEPAAAQPCSEVYAVEGGAPAGPEGPEAIEERDVPEMAACDGSVGELEVIDVIEGNGEEVIEGDSVTVHYIGAAATTGEVFDSSWERGEPAEFGLGQVIRGWGEGLVGMKVGGRRTLIIPADLAYGDQGPAPGDALVFTVDLVAREGLSAEDLEVLAQIEARGVPTLEATGPVDELQVVDDVEGTGAAVAEGDSVTVHYVGAAATTGEVFDSSWDRGSPISFPLDEVIRGWGEGLVGMKVGGRRTLIIPADLAYGDQGPAPGDSLVFTVDLVAIG